MRLKSYFAATVEAAIGQARQELGEEAMLVTTRQTSGPARAQGAYEVVFALPEGGRRTAGPEAASGPGAAQVSPRRLLEDFADLRRELERMRQEVARSKALAHTAPAVLQHPEFQRLYIALASEDVSSELALELVLECARRPIRGPDGRISPRLLVKALREAAADRVRADARLKVEGAGAQRRRIVVFVGPPGAGKTTALVKLAVRYGLASRKPMAILALECFQIASCEQLRKFAAILGVSFQTAQSGRALDHCLQEQGNKEWIWIDTPGFGPRDMDAAQELAAWLQQRSEAQVQLVVPATFKVNDLTRVVERFLCFEPDTLLFTRLDETESRGGIWSAAAQFRLPVSFLCAGQQIPEDVEPAAQEVLLDMVMNRIDPAPLESRNAHTHAGRAAAGM